MKFFDLRYETFGIDINDASIKIVALGKKRGNFVLKSINEIEFEPEIIEDGIIKKEDVLAEIIRSACRDVVGKKIKTKYVVASLPEEKSFLQIIQVPNMNEDELRTAVPLEAENYIPLPIEDVYIDFDVLRPLKSYLNHSEVLIYATPKKIVDSYVSCLKMAGLIPLALELESTAIARAIIKNNNTSPVLIIDFGQKETTFILYAGYSVRFSCSIPIGSSMLTEEISKSLNITLKEAEDLKIKYGLKGLSYSPTGGKISSLMYPILKDLAEQIIKYLTFYQEHSSYEYLLGNFNSIKIMLCGGGAELSGFENFMSEQMKKPVELANPLTNIYAKNATKSIKKDLLSVTTAIGLAQKKIDIIKYN